MLMLEISGVRNADVGDIRSEEGRQEARLEDSNPLLGARESSGWILAAHITGTKDQMRQIPASLRTNQGLWL